VLVASLVAMLTDVCYSEIGRTTHQHLNNLRRQLGTGVDPAYDYSAMHELQKQLANAGKQSSKQRNERNQKDNGSAPASGLDLLKRTLKEVVGVGAGGDDADSEQGDAATIQRRARSSPAETNKMRELTRNTSAFKASTRDSLKKMDIENRFRAPPIGSYRPKDVVVRPKHICHVFHEDGHTRSIKNIALDQEIERLLDEGQPVIHLTHPAVSIELKEGIPENPLMTKTLSNRQMSKDLPRPDLLKSCKIHFQDNSFTAGVLDGDKIRFDRQPVHDFALTSTAPDKVAEWFWQPGQYDMHLNEKLRSSKPKTDLKNIPMHQQQGHQPLREIVGGQEIKKPRPTLHLPDRSLYRPAAISLDGLAACAPLETRVKNVDIKRGTNRPPPYKYIPPMYDVTNPEIVEKVKKNFESFEAFTAMKAQAKFPKTKIPEDFSKSLNRLQHLKVMRSYADDQCLQLAKNNLIQGLVSVELLPMDSIYEKPQLQQRIQVKDLTTMPGREKSYKCKALPPRGHIDKHEALMTFGRGTRGGDSKPETQNLSKLAGAITELRGSRSYDALPRQDHPMPSVDES